MLIHIEEMLTACVLILLWTRGAKLEEMVGTRFVKSSQLSLSNKEFLFQKKRRNIISIQEIPCKEVFLTPVYKIGDTFMSPA